MYGRKNALIIGGSSETVSIFSSKYDTELISSIQFLESILFSFKPDVVVLDCVYDADIRRIRKIESLALVPIMVLAEDMAYVSSFETICLVPNVFVCNTTLLSNKNIQERVGAIISKKGAMLPARTASFVKKALLFINKNASHQFARSHIAQSLGITDDYLSRLFRNEMGLSLWDYVLLFRLEEAKRLLIETGLSVKEIASRTGFVDAAYFTRQFCKHYLVSPTTFRTSPL